MSSALLVVVKRSAMAWCQSWSIARRWRGTRTRHVAELPWSYGHSFAVPIIPITTTAHGAMAGCTVAQWWPVMRSRWCNHSLSTIASWQHHSSW